MTGPSGYGLPGWRAVLYAGMTLYVLKVGHWRLSHGSGARGNTDLSIVRTHALALRRRDTLWMARRVLCTETGPYGSCNRKCDRQLL